MSNSYPSLRSRLHNGEYVSGIWLMTPSLEFAEMVRVAELDFVVIDMEHGLHSLDTVLAQLRVVQGGRTAAIVRIPSHDVSLVARVLDRGADGIMVPKVPNAEVARQLAQASRFPPFGERGLAIRALRASQYGANASYREDSDNNALMIVQIESAEAVENVEVICGVPGIDMAFIGPADLSANLRLEGPDNAEAFAQVVETTAKRVRGAGALFGMMPVGNCTAERMKAAEAQLMVVGSDIGIMSSGLAAHVRQHGTQGY